MAEKSLLLQILDHLWKEHLLHLDHLRQGIHLRGYGQRDPLNEYKREAFELFEAMLTNLRQTVTQVLTHLEIRAQPQQVAVAEAAEAEPLAATGTDDARPVPAAARPAPAPRRRGRSWRRRDGPAAAPRRAGARCRATRPAPAARARSTSTATAGSREPARGIRSTAPRTLTQPGTAALGLSVRFFRAAPAALVGLGSASGLCSQAWAKPLPTRSRCSTSRGRSGRRPPTMSSAASTRRWTQGAELIVLRMDTPGGLADSMRIIIQEILRRTGAGGRLRRAERRPCGERRHLHPLRLPRSPRWRPAPISARRPRCRSAAAVSAGRQPGTGARGADDGDAGDEGSERGRPARRAGPAWRTRSSTTRSPTSASSRSCAGATSSGPRRRCARRRACPPPRRSSRA